MLPLETVQAWTARMERESQDLDFQEADDRAAFRSRMVYAMSNLKASVARDLALHHGKACPGNCSHATAVRACADAWMVNR